MNPFRYFLNRPSRSRTQRRRASGVVPTEALETRCLLTGNVTVSLNGDNVIIEGDEGDNAFEVTRFDGDIVIRSRDATRINGSTGRYVVLEDTNTIAGNLVLRLGQGDDTAIITRDFGVQGDVRVAGGAGNDTLGILRTVIDGELRVVMGSGRDNISVVETTIGEGSNLKGNNGPDTVSVQSTNIAGESLISTSGGDDNVVIRNSVFGDELSVSGGNENDAVFVESTRFNDDLDIVTIGGEDVIQVIDSRVEGASFLGLGAGDDELTLGQSGLRNVFVGDFRTNGSGGNDTYDQQNNVFQAGRDVERFDVEEAFDLTEVQEAIDTAETAADGINDLFVYRSQSVTTVPDEAIESVGTYITRNQATVFVGTSSNDAWITIDADNDGEFDDGSGRADEFGDYAITASLQPGETTIQVKAVDDEGTEHISEVDVHYAVGSVAEFQTSLGVYHVELLDEDAPLTVANYKNYFDAYEQSFIHRSIDGFVIQGGGFEFVNGQIGALDTNPPVENEFNADNSNLRGTLSTALSSSIDSATNQWFINLEDNVGLDDARHTVFGRVIGDGMDIVDAIAGVDVFNLDGRTFSDTPLRDYAPFSRELTGSVELTAGSTLLTGTDTLFTQELSIGSQLRVVSDDGEVAGVFLVSAIVSDTELTLSTLATASHTNAVAQTHESVSDQHIVFNDIDEVLAD